MSRRDSITRAGSFAHARSLRVEPLEERRVLALDAVLVRDINPGSDSSGAWPLGNVNGELFIAAYHSTGGVGLWKSDGTEAGTVLVKDFWSVAANFKQFSRTNANGTLFFLADDGATGRELWKSDGTEAGTVQVKDIQQGSETSRPYFLTDVDGTLFFSADNGTNGRELWKSDGTEAGTVLVKDIRPGPYQCYEHQYDYYGYPFCVRSGGSSFPESLTSVNGTLFFTTANATGGTELWKSDGTEASTVRLKEIRPGGMGHFLKSLTDVNGTLFFSAYSDGSGIELWKSNGTEAGTVRVKDIRPGSHDSSPGDLTNVNGTLFFTAHDGNDFALWKSDGTESGTVRVKDTSASNFALSYLTNVNGTLFFINYDGGGGRPELWKSDGTEAGTVRVAHSFAFRYLTSVNGRLFFSAEDGAHGRELWTSDGTEAGTLLVKDIWEGPYQCYEYDNEDGCVRSGGSSYPRFLTNSNGTLYFTAEDGIHGRELWKVVVADEATPGDTNGDGAVNIEDLNNVRNHFGETGDGVLGDTAPFDGKVDIQDLNAVRNSFGAPPPTAPLHALESAEAAASTRLSVSATRWRQAWDAVFGMWANAPPKAPRSPTFSRRTAR